MNDLEKAIELDIQGDILGAIGAFEAYFAHEEKPSLNALINCTFIYWQLTDFGFSATLHIPLSVVHAAGERYLSLLDKAQALHGEHTDIIFWRMYFDEITLGNPPFVSVCEELVSRPGCSLDPYFYLYQFHPDRYARESTELLDQCRKYPTYKNRYIQSVIESAQRQF